MTSKKIIKFLVKREEQDGTDKESLSRLRQYGEGIADAVMKMATSYGIPAARTKHITHMRYGEIDLNIVCGGGVVAQICIVFDFCIDRGACEILIQYKGERILRLSFSVIRGQICNVDCKLY